MIGTIMILIGLLIMFGLRNDGPLFHPVKFVIGIIVIAAGAYVIARKRGH